MSQNGKGHKRRPMQVTQEEFDFNYESIFGKKRKECRTKSGCCCEDCGPCEECVDNEREDNNND